MSMCINHLCSVRCSLTRKNQQQDEKINRKKFISKTKENRKIFN